MIGASIGNFDGVHLGHRALLEALQASGRSLSSLIAVTFEPAPAVVLGRSAEPRILTAPQRRRQLLELGFDDVLELPTTPELLALEPLAFLDRLVASLGGNLSLLAEGRPVLDVALTCGYESPSAFSAMFQRSLGRSPSAYFAGRKDYRHRHR